MKIMVVGGGGREHAIIKKLKENKNIEKIYALPGNGGIAGDAECVDIGAKDIEKITIYSADIEVLNDIRKHYENSNEVSVASSHPANLELTKKGVTKATALSELCNRLGITAENVMAFGDSGNDCDMLDFAKWSFAMANASEECKASAKYETRSNAESGVAYAVTKYAL